MTKFLHNNLQIHGYETNHLLLIFCACNMAIIIHLDLLLKFFIFVSNIGLPIYLIYWILTNKKDIMKNTYNSLPLTIKIFFEIYLSLPLAIKLAILFYLFVLLCNICNSVNILLNNIYISDTLLNTGNGSIPTSNLSSVGTGNNSGSLGGGGPTPPNINNPMSISNLLNRVDPVDQTDLRNLYNKLSELVISADNRGPNKWLTMNSPRLKDLSFDNIDRYTMELQLITHHPNQYNDTYIFDFVPNKGFSCKTTVNIRILNLFRPN